MLRRLRDACGRRGPGTLIPVGDDDGPVQRVATGLLEDLAFSVIEANSGPEASALTRNQTELVLVISHVNMPEFDGPSLVEEPKSMRPSLPVIMMSGRPYRDRTHPLLAKPFSQRAIPGCIGGVGAPMAGLGTDRAMPPP